jgi:hypothetical protein
VFLLAQSGPINDWEFFGWVSDNRLVKGDYEGVSKSSRTGPLEREKSNGIVLCH